MISIIGKSGSGKTTLLNIILGLIEPKNGKIFIDDKETILNNSNWQKKIGYVPQDVYLLDDTIKKNIILEEIVDLKEEKRINLILKILNLNEVVERLDKESKNSVGDAGTRLSGGENKESVLLELYILSQKYYY